MIVYGPVPSRRLGRSLGINNIPPKTCTYSCIYCQVGRTRKMRIERQAFYEPAQIVRRVQDRIAILSDTEEEVDYLSFVPDGEPTLDVHLGREIDALHGLNLPVAVITNGSLLTRPDVREELAAADWVSLKVDAVDEPTWRRLNRAHHLLDLPAILEGLLTFRNEYHGDLVSESMLVAGVNDSAAHAESLADFLALLHPRKAYISVPTRPPARPDVQPASGAAIVRCHEAVSSKHLQAECLVGYEGNSFAAAGDPKFNLLGVTAVHPMRHEAVVDLLERAGAPWCVVEELLTDGRLLATEYEGRTYYLSRPGWGIASA